MHMLTIPQKHVGLSECASLKKKKKKLMPSNDALITVGSTAKSCKKKEWSSSLRWWAWERLSWGVGLQFRGDKCFWVFGISYLFYPFDSFLLANIFYRRTSYTGLLYCTGSSPPVSIYICPKSV